MSNGQENQLTCSDAFGIMCRDIRAIVKERKRHGVMYYPTMKNPALFITHNKDAIISQVDVIFEEVKHDKNGVPILPECSVTYRKEP